MADAVTDALVALTVTDHVAVIRLQRPKPPNLLDREMVGALRDATAAVHQEASVRAVVVAGSGGSFAAGADINVIRGNTPVENLRYNRELAAAMDDVEDLPVPTVAAIDGHALGGGLELALACTFRIAAEHVLLGLPEVRLGILPGAGGLHRLPRVVPARTARRMLLTGARLKAPQALDEQLVDAVAAEAEPAAMELAAEIATAAPLAVRAITDMLRERPSADDLERVDRHLSTLLESSDSREGLDAFLERRSPRFTGR